mmetsp:Transcript_31315/g.72862  ORF Transcript_31315/g.72862 Transcript_31315/m.72862 type:complete len:284 (+) Transcript_31315:473-1324(+)
MREHDAERHVDGDGLAVEKLLLEQGVHLQFQTEDVTEVDEARERILPQVGRELLKHRLDGEVQHARGHGRAAHLAREVLELIRNELGAVLLEEGHQLGVFDDRHLGNLSGAVGELPLVERRKEAAVEDRHRRRQVRAELVLLAIKIHARLGSDRRVNIAHQRRRHADVRRAPPVDGRGEADDVHTHAAADGDHGVVAAVDAVLVDCLCNLQHHVHVLVLLRGWQHHQPHVHAVRLEVSVDTVAVEREHLLVHHDNPLERARLEVHAHLVALCVPVDEQLGLRV